MDQNSIYMNNIARVTRNFDLDYEVRNEPFHSRAGSHCYCSLEPSIELYRKVSPHDPVVHDFRAARSNRSRALKRHLYSSWQSTLLRVSF
jgi:hypothetical protein